MTNPALIDELEKQFRDNPRRVFARLANEYRKSGDVMRAIEICHAHVPQQPGYISGHVVLGQALFDAGELDQAQETFQAALALDPENLIALRQLGDIARNRRDYREARSWYTRLLDVDPQNDEIVAQLGEIALAEGEGAGKSVESAGPSAQAEVELSGVATATAVADDEDAGMPEPADDSASEATEVQDLEAEPEPEFSLDADEISREAPSVAMDAHRPTGHGAGASGEPGDDDVAWIATESASAEEEPVSMESVDFLVSEAQEADATEFIVAEAASDYDESLAPPTDDFDFAFETEEHEEAPLRPHTGESLSIIAEEDALAGVQPVLGFERSPFGDPIGTPASTDADAVEAAFEPLPAEDLEAGAAELPPAIEELGGEDLIHEMARWSLPDEDAGTDAVAAEPYESRDAPPGEIGIDSEAETIIEATSTSDMVLDEASDAEPAVLADAGADWSLPVPAAAPDAEAEPDVAQHADWTDDFGEEVAPAAAPVSEAEHHPATAAQGDDPTPPAFVTETMAELYLQQGFRTEALDVYRRLAAQSPDDASLRDRIAELERSTLQQPAGDAGSTSTRSAAAFFKSLASVEPPPPPPVDPAPSGNAQWDELLSDSGDVSDEDDAAATALSNGFHAHARPEQPRGAATRAADRKMSLHDIFGATDQSERGVTANSLDAFYTPEGERSSSPQGDDEGREDLEAFNAWLEGLKK